MYQATSADDVCRFVRNAKRVRVAGGQSTSLSHDATLSLAALSGVIQYEPVEYTFTAWAGTPLRHLQQLLAEQGQYLPFDPPLVESGATLGGTVAAGLSGPGRFRFGGVRDFLLGVNLVNGCGDLVRGGAKVVKNAAGFDIPKLVVGSLGEFGVLVDLTFKVFPAPQASATLAIDTANLEAAVATIKRLSTQPLDLHHVDLCPPTRVVVRVSGHAAALPERLERLTALVQPECTVEPIADEARFWHAAREFGWVPAGYGVIKVPLVPDQIAHVERTLDSLSTAPPRRYSVAGNVAWIGWPETTEMVPLETMLQDLERPGLQFRGVTDRPLLGPRRGQAFQERIRSIFDPEGKFRIESTRTRTPGDGNRGK